ncbi:ABC-three component system protein [Acinetobacter seifertii]|uniref:ABC-three component systems C-terminal domain-containing protein n=1 Tax=Acinetobacter seifertii TaxID=1530123 RepID=A0ABX8L603_9GAMM|nr:ABC-three component system protein [Acinetobacter seifertii]QXB47205.1 hypothetical protein I6L30_04135 [Acinetobacter seifertii]
MVNQDASTKILGYIFQFRRALFLLFSSPKKNPIVSIESLDDVALMTIDENGKLHVNLEQDKHTVNEKTNPFQDKSKNLWRTLLIWLDSLEETKSKYDEVYYSLVTNVEVGDNSLVNKISMANSEEEIDECISLMNKIKEEIVEGKGNGEIIEKVLKHDISALKFIIKNTNLIANAGLDNKSDSLKETTINYFSIPPSLAEKEQEIYESIFGYLINLASDTWLKKESFFIDKNQVTTRLFTEKSARQSKKFLEQSLLSTNFKKYLEESDNNHLFLRQLNALNLKQSFCNQALEHYWGFYAEKVRLETEGEILPSEWIDRDENLHERWKLIFNKKSMFYEEDDIVGCKEILNETLSEEYHAPIGGQNTSQIYFTLGNYHYLANNEKNNFYIYWHSLFAKKGV